MLTDEPEQSEESFGARLRRLRLERGLSQRQLSAPGVSYAYISRLEAGARRPSVKAIRQLARTLAVSPDYLETGRDLGVRDAREIQLAEAELELRLERDPAAAEESARALVAEATAGGDPATAMRARAVLGLAAHRRGAHHEAIEQLEPVVESGLASPLAQPEVYGALGHAYASVDELDRAVALYERCLEEIEGHDPEAHVASVRFAAYLSYALSDSGDLDAARRVLGDALSRSAEAGDPYSRIRLHWSQARRSASAGDPQNALRELRRATALLETTEDTRQLARAHVLYGEVLTLEGEPSTAAGHLELAERLLGSHAGRADLHWLRTEQARSAARLGEGDEAVGRAEDALALIGEAADPAERGAALWALGEGLEASGRLEESAEALRSAVGLLEGQGRWREASRAARSLASSLRRLDHGDEAFQVLERAASLAGRATSPRTRI